MTSAVSSPYSFLNVFMQCGDPVTIVRISWPPRKKSFHGARPSFANGGNWLTSPSSPRAGSMMMAAISDSLPLIVSVSDPMSLTWNGMAVPVSPRG